MLKNVLMIAFHCYRVYKTSKEHNKKKAFVAYEHILDTPLSSINYRHPLYQNDRPRKLKSERILHRTLRRPSSTIHGRLTRTPRTVLNCTPPSISYPFARRRNDGGRARTAFAFYGLPFRTPQIPQSTTISSCSILSAKSFFH